VTDKGVTDAMRRGMAFISSAQLSTGAFESWSSPTQLAFKPDATYQTTFVPSLILGAISRLNDPLILPIRDKLATWLQTQKSTHWSFNYWATSAPQRDTMPYPDDLDDTFCALLALYQHDSSIINEACLANVVKILIATENKVGGPYKTWLTSDPAATWQDIDLAVNANIAAFLRLVAEPLPNITKLLNEAITKQMFTSPYYPSPYPIIY
jgi:hypothetical protein